MIRKTISILFAITMFFSMTTVAMAESFQIYKDKSVVSSGETVTISIVLDEAMNGEFRNIQGQLSYDTDLLAYVSHQGGEEYSGYTYADMADRKYFTFSYTDFTDDGLLEISKGTVVSVKFKVNDGVTEEHLKAALMLTVNVQDVKGRTDDLTSESSVLICNEEQQESADSQDGNDEEVCEKCGKKYVAGEASSTRAVNGDIDNSQTGGQGYQNNGLLIAAIVTAMAAVCVFIVYRRKCRK